MSRSQEPCTVAGFRQRRRRRDFASMSRPTSEDAQEVQSNVRRVANPLSAQIQISADSERAARDSSRSGRSFSVLRSVWALRLAIHFPSHDRKDRQSGRTLRVRTRVPTGGGFALLDAGSTEVVSPNSPPLLECEWVW